LDNMLDICYSYSCKWRYFYNAKKCAVLVFNDSANPSLERTYRIGPDVIRETQIHIGIFCDENLSTKHQVSDACVKLMMSYMNVVKNGLQLGRINPKVIRTIFKSVVLPRALYGCETWTNRAPSDMLLLERANSFCVKHMQCYGKYTSNMYRYLTIDIGLIYLEIDYRKLLMFGQLCRLKCSYLAKNVFVNRLTRFMNFDKKLRGFIPDTYRLLQKYGIVQCLDLYLTTGQFP